MSFNGKRGLDRTWFAFSAFALIFHFWFLIYLRYTLAPAAPRGVRGFAMYWKNI